MIENAESNSGHTHMSSGWQTFVIMYYTEHSSNGCRHYTPSQRTDNVTTGVKQRQQKSLYSVVIPIRKPYDEHAVHNCCTDCLTVTHCRYSQNEPIYLTGQVMGPAAAVTQISLKHINKLLDESSWDHPDSSYNESWEYAS